MIDVLSVVLSHTFRRVHVASHRLVVFTHCHDDHRWTLRLRKNLYCNYTT